MDDKHNQRIYREEDWIAKVEIVEDSSDDEWYRYKLRVLGTVISSRFFKTPEDGHVFDVCFKKDSMAYCNWNLDAF